MNILSWPHLFLSALFFFSLDGQARPIPPLTGAVIDEAQVFSQAQKQYLEQTLQNYLQASGVQIQVAFLSSLDGDPIEDFSIRAVDEWKLGSAKEDKGLLILFALQERKSRIEVGQGLEGEITDILTGRLLRDIRPLMKEARYGEAVTFLLTELTANLEKPLVISPDKQSSFQPQATTKKSSLFVTLFKLFIFLLFILFYFLAPLLPFQSQRRSWGHSSGGWGGGGSSGGGSSWSGGGGGFSGGGSSSDW
jgi:uncharacterized protein